MPPVGFEPTIPVSERPQTHTLDCTATGIGSYNIYDNETGLNVVAEENIGCEVNVVYEPTDNGLIKAETCVGVEK
jgi:hypothetical protein